MSQDLNANNNPTFTKSQSQTYGIIKISPDPNKWRNCYETEIESTTATKSSE